MLREEVRAKVSPSEYGLSIGTTCMWPCQRSCTRALLRHQDHKLLHTQVCNAWGSCSLWAARRINLHCASGCLFRLIDDVHLPTGLLPLQAQFISPQELQFAQQKGLPIIDVRPLSEYEAGRIPGSKHAQFMRAITGRQCHRPHLAVCTGQRVAGGG